MEVGLEVDGTKEKINMKSPVVIVASILCLLSCQNSMDDSLGQCRTLSFFVPAFEEVDQPLTKTNIVNSTNFVWSASDTVGIYPNSGGQVFFSMSEGAGAQYATFDGGGWAFRQSSLYYGYYPFVGDIYLQRDYIPVSYRYQRQNGINSTEHIGSKDYMSTAPTSSSGDALNFIFNHLSCIIRPRLTLPAGIYTKLSIVIDEPLFVMDGYYSLLDENPEIVGTSFSNTIDLILDNIILSEQTQFLTYVMAAPVELTGRKVKIIVYDNAGNQFEYEKTPSFTYSAGKICGLTCTEYTSSPVGGVVVGGDDENMMGDDSIVIHM